MLPDTNLYMCYKFTEIPLFTRQACLIECQRGSDSADNVVENMDNNELKCLVGVVALFFKCMQLQMKPMRAMYYLVNTKSVRENFITERKLQIHLILSAYLN